MRQWHVDPKLMCRKHLLGEHVEHHMFARCLELGKSLDGYLAGGLVELQTLEQRHEALAAEMLRRGYKHASPLAVIPAATGGRVDRARALKELRRRCRECKART